MYFERKKALKILFVKKHIPYATKEHLHTYDLYIKCSLKQNLYLVDNYAMENICMDDNK